MSQELAAQIGRRFIQNRDVKAIQFSNGDYVPDFKMKDPARHGLGFKMPHLAAHLAGTDTYGHYLLDKENNARLFAFDIDLEKKGNYVDVPSWPALADTTTNEEFDAQIKLYDGVNPRELWLDRTQDVARMWYKVQMMRLVRKFVTTIEKELGIPCAAAYSGGKGVHVYGFTGPLPADEVRAGADLVMECLPEFAATKGKHFFGHKNLDPVTGFQNFSIEVFPKQTNLDGKNVGNLMRLPLGRNQKSTDPTFFLDLKAPPEVMRPHPNPLLLLESGDPYA